MQPDFSIFAFLDSYKVEILCLALLVAYAQKRALKKRVKVLETLLDEFRRKYQDEKK